MALKLSNRATSLLAGSIDDVVTAISVTASTGSRFPTLGVGDWFPVVVVAADGSYEIMRCTARTGDVMTVTRAQESTSALSFAAGAVVDLRLTNAAMAALVTEITTAYVAADAVVTAAHVAADAVVTAAYIAADTASRTTLRGEMNAPSGTTVLFRQTAAPTGWTKSVTHNDKALRVVSGAVSNGGSLAFSTVFSRTTTDNITLSATHLPSYTPTGFVDYAGATVGLNSGTTAQFGKTLGSLNAGSTEFMTFGSGFTLGVTGSTPVPGFNESLDGGNNNGGASTSFSGGMDIRVQYVDVIIASKD